MSEIPEAQSSLQDFKPKSAGQGKLEIQISFSWTLELQGLYKITNLDLSEIFFL